ncbi:MAG: hypothetical protein NVSMB27_03740 [Ktedonobacteraceae bacterium]
MIHTLLGLSSLLLVMFASYLVLSALRSIRDWSQRRTLQLFVLTMPIVVLGLGMSQLHELIVRLCALRQPSWDVLLGVVLPLGMGMVALCVSGMGVIRLMLMKRVVACRGVFSSPGLQVLADTLIQGINTARAEVLLCPYDRPLALTYGLWRPTVLLSTWMLEHLDQRELEAVLAHELEHVARHDYLVIWLARVLRDAFFYLPTSRMAYRQLQREKELACDDLAVGVTHRPLALASALAKVWLHAVDDPRHTLFGGAAQSIMEVGASIHGRIQRLLTSYEPMTSTQRSRIGTLGLSVSALIALGVMQGANLLIILALMGCNPVVLLQKML